MKNPAEELVTAWLQECREYFTRNNIKVPRAGGGMGAEIDILATNGRQAIWVEVAVSTNPRCNHRKEVRFQETVKDYLSDFIRPDKNKMAKEIFRGKKYSRWLVHGKLALSQNEIERFPEEMKKHGVITVGFQTVIDELVELKDYRLDSARGYINLMKAFNRPFGE